MVPGRDFSSSNYSTASVTNANGTVTVTATAVLSGFHGNSTQVGCEVRLFSGALMEVFTTISETIPEASQSSTVGLDKESAVDESGFSATMIGIAAAVAVAGAVFITMITVVSALIIQKSRNRSHRDPEKEKTTVKETQEAQASLVTQENEQIRQ
ncbi:uncharacterized protein LOC144543027 [Centroberyx gerrardi]